ncbi:hypothetical protein ASPVEDRAFT_880579 [Aspergillus versicolor CBS 583.65]|uniref:HD domain-containing protein n=1 Tax=Aspergillus versicolor CBS 583.65 TaxID=1036611 RepID=A0A1L9P949_ASPVE|nr:uncharacterized protein ASPVEDRAFT_880579 [Aspergillus versicolor CBS 583.65]OJI98060.1 hypothetical protein ASPVEDRAFT_880579 [Aspergillus versicolor CBS 583.65]
MANPHETIKTLFAFILAQGQGDYLGERISQLQHSLQCAYLAHSDPTYGTDSEVVLAALLHDVGRFIPDAKDMPAMIAPDGAYIGRASHEVLGERYLRQLGFSEKVCQLVGAHVLAKRFLVSTEEEYYGGLSETSKRTLKFQGGFFTEEQVRDARNDPWLDAKLAVRRWDDRAKDPEMEVPGLDAYEDMAVRCLVDSRARVVVVDKLYALPVKPVFIVVLSEALFDQAVHDGVLSGMKSHGWIVEKYLHMKNGNRRPVEEEVLDQLSRRGVQVAQMSADSDTISSLPSDTAGRSRLVIEKGLSMLQNDAFLHLSLAAELQYIEFSEMLDNLQYLTRDTVVAITAISNSGCTKTVFDAVFQRASV